MRRVIGLPTAKPLDSELRHPGPSDYRIAVGPRSGLVRFPFSADNCGYSYAVRKMFFLLVLAFTPVLNGIAADDVVIQDPIADYLAMQVPDRATNAEPLLVIKKVEVDIAGDGNPVVFIGTWYRNSGPNTWLWVGYRRMPSGFIRITPSHADMLIDFSDIYVGFLPDLNRQGMAQAYSLELDNKDRSQSNIISDLTFYYLQDNKLVEQGSGMLDLEDSSQKAKYDFYFGPDREVRDHPQIEAFTIMDLARRGYKIPKPPPKPPS